MAYISKIRVPGVETAYLIKDNEGRLMIAEAYPGSTPSEGSYYVQDGKLYVVNSTGPTTTTVGEQLQSIKQSIAGAMHYIGVTKTVLTDGATTAKLDPLDDKPNSLSKQTGFKSGDVVLAPVTGKDEKYYEYVWNGDMWSEFGSTKPIGQMAYANTATGSTTITYNKSVYTGGTVEVNDYSEGESEYLGTIRVLQHHGDGNLTASRVTAKDRYLETTKIGVIMGDTSAEAVTNVTTTQKGLSTTQIYGVDGTGAAVTEVTSTNKKLGTTSIYGVSGTGAAVTEVSTTKASLDVQKIYGVESEGVNVVSNVKSGSTSINVGASKTTSVVSGLGATAVAASAGYKNPFVGAAIDEDDECLSWIEKPLINTDILEASATSIPVPDFTVEYVNGIAKVASNSVTVATGSIGGKKVELITGVTTTTDSFAKKSEKETTVATGALVNKDDAGNGDMVAIGVTTTTDSFAKKAQTGTTVATGELTDDGDIVTYVGCETRTDFATYAGTTTVANGYISNIGDGSSITEAFEIEEVYGVITMDELNEVNVLQRENPGDTSSVRVLSGITSTAATKNVTLTKGADEIHSIDVAITVTPDKRS